VDEQTQHQGIPVSRLVQFVMEGTSGSRLEDRNHLGCTCYYRATMLEALQSALREQGITDPVEVKNKLMQHDNNACILLGLTFLHLCTKRGQASAQE